MLKKQNDSFFDAFLAGIIVSIGVIWLLEEDKKRKRRIKLLEQTLDEGYYLDKLNLDSDWNNVRNDIAYSYEKILEESL